MCVLLVFSITAGRGKGTEDETSKTPAVSSETTSKAPESETGYIPVNPNPPESSVLNETGESETLYPQPVGPKETPAPNQNLGLEADGKPLPPAGDPGAQPKGIVPSPNRYAKIDRSVSVRRLYEGQKFFTPAQLYAMYYEALKLTKDSPKMVNLKGIHVPSYVKKEFLTINRFSRPGIPLYAVHDIAVHYVGNPGSTARENRDFFEELKTGKPDDGVQRSASAHFVIGLKGEVIQCIPLDEKSYCTNWRNFDTISIEVCHPDSSGKFTAATYDSLTRLLAWLCKSFHLTSENIIRHYDVTEKLCPIYYVLHPDAWKELKGDVRRLMAN